MTSSSSRHPHDVSNSRSSESRTLRSTQTRGTIMVFISASSSARKCSVTPGMQSDRREARSSLRARVRWDRTCSSGTRMATSLNCLSIAVGEPDSSPFQTRGGMIPRVRQTCAWRGTPPPLEGFVSLASSCRAVSGGVPRERESPCRSRSRASAKPRCPSFRLISSPAGASRSDGPELPARRCSCCTRGPRSRRSGWSAS